MNIAIIPARKGSKRIINKNFKNFLGKPIIEYSINAVLKSKLFNKVIINSDFEEKKIFKKYNEIIFSKRPKYLSKDHVAVTKIISYQINKLNLNKNFYKNINVCLVYPTACMLRASDLKKSLKIFIKNKTKFVLSVNKINENLTGSYIKNKKYLQASNLSNKVNKESYYQDSGYFCWANANTWSKGKNCRNSETLPYLLKSKECHDINTIDDWNEAKKKFLRLKDV